MELNLQGKTAVITGGGSGIGKAAALEFAREGCNVAICGRTQEKLSAAEQELKQMGCRVLTCAMDVSDLPSLQKFADEVVKTFGGIDIWVNNAGVSRPAHVLDLTEQDWDYVININLKGLFFASQYAARHMKNRGGVILNISSFATVIPRVGGVAYSAAKSAVNSLTRTFAAECARYGIRVVSVIPGMIRTDMTQENINQNSAALTADISLHRLGEAEDLAKPIVFLSSDACGYMTGVNVEISGGKFSVQNPEAAWK